MATKKKKKRKAKNLGGRPRMPDTERKRRFISIRVSEEEWEAIAKAADGFPVHTWCRVHLLKLAKQQMRKRKS